jgi:hypothetical protein
MAELMSRLAAVEKERDALKIENGRLRSQIAAWDPNFSLKLDLPDAEQALALWKKITSKYPRMISPSDSQVDQAAGMVAAMGYCFSVTATRMPTTRFDGSYWTARATEFANSARMFCPRIRSVLIGIIATNDVDFHLSNSDLYLDPHGRGRAVDRSAWRALLNGAPLREPTPIERKVSDASVGFVRQASAW